MFRTLIVFLWVPIYFIFSIVVVAPLLKLLSLFAEKKAAELSIALVKNWGRQFIFYTGNKVEVIIKDKTGLDNIKDEPIVVIANHQSNLDIPLVIGYLPKYVGFVAKKEMETWPIIGLWMKRIHCVFLDRTDPRKAVLSMREAVEKIKSGNSVTIFPEGTRSPDGVIGEFKKGSFKLATEPGVKILPVTIKGTRDVLKKGSYLVRKTDKIKLIIDSPVDISAMDKDELKNINELIRNKIINNYNE